LKIPKFQNNQAKFLEFGGGGGGSEIGKIRLTSLK